MERVGQGGNTRSLEGRSSGEEENGKGGGRGEVVEDEV